MADMNSRATIELQCNGQQVSNTLEKLKEKASNLELAIAKAAAAGNKGDVQKFERQLRQTNKEIRNMSSAADNAQRVLMRMSQATPKELSQTLSTLQRQLKGIERGSSAWDEQVKKIQRVKSELAKVNEELKEGKSALERFNDTFSSWQNAVVTGAAAVTGLVMAGRKAVNAYAEMEQEEANVRKYTGMTAEEVGRLNEEFRKMDTRTSREALNQLAQEAGRLGKQSLEDVMGFVRAADVINVALDDLGEGATLTLSKLTNIFGDEEKYGTERALLKVGSVINELSQNCTASAPYLAQFAQRLAGVGSQAGLTVPQLMAFGAVLDSQGQAVEMSATALSKLITDMFKRTGLIAKATGLDLKEFQAAIKRSTNEGLVMLLERLHELGDMSVLAEVFADMKEDGSRATGVLAALAGNIDMVKQQQEAANQAYREGTSVTTEFNVQNNTVMAGLEKARKRANEMAVELGQKLAPAMKHVYSSTTLMLKVLSAIVTFLTSHIRLVASVTVAIVAYTVAVNASTIATKAAAAAQALYNGVAKAGAFLMGTVKTAALLLKAAYVMVAQGSTRAYQAQVALNAAMKANPIGLLVTGITLLTAGIMKYVSGLERTKSIQSELNTITREAEGQAAAEMAKIQALIDVANDETVAMEHRLQAVKDLNAIIPDYNAQLDIETGKYTASEEALRKFNDELIRKAKLEGAQAKMAELGKEQSEVYVAKQEAYVRRAEAVNDNAAAEAAAKKHNSERRHAPAMVGSNYGIVTLASSEYTMNQLALSQTQARIDAENNAIDNLTKREKELEERQKTLTRYINENGGSVAGGDETPSPTSNDNGGGGDKEKKRFKKEKEWRATMEAEAQMRYYKGETDYEEYQMRLLEIQSEYAAKILARTDLTAKEEAEARELQAEAEFKRAKLYTERSLRQMEDEYTERKAILTQRYADGEMTQQVYNEAMRQLELEHMRQVISLYKEGTAERRKAQAAYDKAVLDDQVKRRQTAEQEEKKHLQELKKIRKQAFGNTAADNNIEYQREKALLDEAYRAELVACQDNAQRKLEVEKAYQIALFTLRQQWAKKGSTLAKDELPASFKTAILDSVEWLKSDGGQAFTQSLEMVVSQMGQIFSGLSTMIQAELEMQTAAIEGKYSKEVEAAEGNQYKVKQIEAKKEKELAEAKNKASKKQYTMQVIQAVAQTATAAINAYSSAAAIPLVGFIMAPIAASMAIAAGMMQVAALKKQQQASASAGYAEGGFTPKGGKYQPAGIVHAGEWMASQELLANPVARPLIEALDYAQQHNTIGSLRPRDVASPAYQAAMANATRQQAPVVNVNLPERAAEGDRELTNAIARLNNRLNEPFVTVNTVTGDAGIAKAQEEYNLLMRNKTPKSRRNP